MHIASLLQPALGGALIGLAASVYLAATGRIAGVSGILASAPSPGPQRWFLAGLATAGLAARLFAPGAIGSPSTTLLLTAIAGAFVGFGTRLGSGCTSGHGVCGLSRLSVRSLVATCTFIAAGIATVAVTRKLGFTP